MVEHITLHESENEFVGKKKNLVIPHVALTMDDFVVHYIDKSDYSNRYLSFVAKEDGTFKFSGNSINYSLDDGSTWIELASETNTPTVNNGDRIMWKGNLTPPPSSGIGDIDGIGIFSSSGKFDVEGNVMSLLYGDGFEGKVTLSDDYEFSMLFKGCTHLENARRMSLPATTLTKCCYRSMFEGCTSLTTVPKLQATTLSIACYTYMFKGCTSLTKAPNLLAETLTSECYLGMFSGCTSLTEAPQMQGKILDWRSYGSMLAGCTSLTEAPELPATTLYSNCYQSMFKGCTSLTEAPELPATTLENYCYEFMFEDCTSLTEAPELPATTLKNYCYQSMFRGCTSLTEAPELKATTLTQHCYNNMFEGCTSLNKITCLATDISAIYCTQEWVNGVAANGTFVKNASMSSWTSGVDGIPSGWTVTNAI